MSRIVRLFLTAALWSSVSAAQGPPPGVPPGFIPPARDNSGAPSTATIRGHVFDASNGQPLRKVQVRAFSAELRENRLAITDNNGVYEIKNLPAGRFSLTAQKGSFVPLQYGQTRPNEQGRPLQIQSAQQLDNVDFRLPHGAIVTGRVVDELGEPTSDTQVSIQRYQYINGRRQLVPGRFAQTNDIGEFRLFGIPPGQYVISANLRGPINPNDAPSDDRTGYAPTYYPSAVNVNDAQRITLAVGQVMTDINISLSPTHLARISGSAVDANGKPMTGGMIMVAQVSGIVFSSTLAGQIRPDGTFAVGGVTPGDYILRVMPINNGLGGIPNEVAQTNITVAGDDVNDIRLISVKPLRVTGRVIGPIVNGSGMSLGGLQLTVAPKIPMPLGGGGGGRTNDDGTFELSTQPGESLIRMNATGAFAGARIKAVRLNGVDVIDTGINLRPDEDVSGLEIELTTQLSSLSGVVTDGRGNTVRDYSVVIFPREKEKWGPGSRYLNFGRPDQDGRYKALNLPPGDYYAIALDYVEQGSNADPEFLERVREKATEFSMTDAETKNLDLRLVTGM